VRRDGGVWSGPSSGAVNFEFVVLHERRSYGRRLRPPEETSNEAPFLRTAFDMTALRRNCELDM
jgi:hypothetical protein